MMRPNFSRQSPRVLVRQASNAMSTVPERRPAEFFDTEISNFGNGDLPYPLQAPSRSASLVRGSKSFGEFEKRLLLLLLRLDPLFNKFNKHTIGTQPASFCHATPIERASRALNRSLVSLTPSTPPPTGHFCRCGNNVERSMERRFVGSRLKPSLGVLGTLQMRSARQGHRQGQERIGRRSASSLQSTRPEALSRLSGSRLGAGLRPNRRQTGDI